MAVSSKASPENIHRHTHVMASWVQPNVSNSAGEALWYGHVTMAQGHIQQVANELSPMYNNFLWCSMVTKVQEKLSEEPKLFHI